MICKCYTHLFNWKNTDVYKVRKRQMPAKNLKADKDNLYKTLTQTFTYNFKTRVIVCCFYTLLLCSFIALFTFVVFNIYMKFFFKGKLSKPRHKETQFNSICKGNCHSIRCWYVQHSVFC